MSDVDPATEYLRLTRETVQRVRCPRCAAEPGESCIRNNGARRTSNHSARVTKARQLFGAQLTAGRANEPGELGRRPRGESGGA